MKTTLTTHGTRDLNPVSGAYTTTPRTDFARLMSSPVSPMTADRSGAWPVATGITRGARTAIFDHEISTGGDGHDVNLAAVRSLYAPHRGVQLLTFTMGGHSMTVYARALQMLPHDSGAKRLVVTGQWEILGGLYYGASAQTVAGAAKTSTPATVAVTNNGNAPSDRLVVTFQPTAAKTAANGQRYLHYVNVLHRAKRDAAAWPVELTGGWDHAAEVTATRSMSSGNDVEVYVNGRREMRWFGTGAAAVNQATSRLWANLDLPAAREWPNATGAALTVGQTEFYTDAQLVNIPSVPFWAILYDGTNFECVRVTDYDQAAGKFTIQRAQRGTSAAAHGAGVSLWWMPVTVEIVYGWTSATTPYYIDDRFKPIPASHASSTNNAWTFANYQETDLAADTQARMPRTGSWRTARRPYPDWTGREELYRNWIVGNVGSPATTLQIVYNHDGAIAGRPLAERWEFRSPIGISQYDFVETTTNLTHPGAPNEGKMELRVVATDGTETVVDTYAANTANSESKAFSPPVLYIAHTIKPWDPSDKDDNTTGSDNLVAQEPTDGDGYSIAAAAVVTFDTTERLTVNRSARTDAYQIGRPDAPATLADSDSGTMYLAGIVLALSDTLTVSVTAGTATVGDGTGRAHLITGLRDVRIPADPLAPPETTNLTYTETGLTGGASVTIAVTDYRSAWN